MDLNDSVVTWLSRISFTTMAIALVVGSVIILHAMFKGIRAERKEMEALPAGQPLEQT
jgi:hypothetical protein